jgi:hypothetical protein
MLFICLLLSVAVILSSESQFLFDDPSLGPKIGGLITSVFQVLMAAYYVLVVRLLGYSKRYINIVLGAFVLGMFVAFYVSNPLFDVIQDGYKPVVYGMSHGGTILLNVFMASIILKDIFGSKETHSDHIWGAIVVYVMMIMVFADIYEVISLYTPEFLGAYFEMGWPNYTQIIMYSINSASGMDALFPNAHPLLLKLGNLQNIISNLYLIVILGRLLSHPLGLTSKPD